MGVFHGFLVKIVPLNHGHPEILPGATHAGMKSEVCCRTPLFLRKKTGENHGIPGDVMVLHGFNMFQCISMVSLEMFGSSYLDSEIE